jgi:Tol biopolymer transport system component
MLRCTKPPALLLFLFLLAALAATGCQALNGGASAEGESVQAAATPTQGSRPAATNQPANEAGLPTPVVRTTLTADLPTPSQSVENTLVAPTATQAAPTLRQLTSGGCCPGPFWSPDGQSVRYLDKPSPDAPAGFWEVSLSGGEPRIWTENLGIYSPDGSLRAFPEEISGGKQTVVERAADGQRWAIPSGGRAVSFSPDSTRVTWTAGAPGPPFDTALREIWVSGVDGSDPRMLQALYGGGFTGWLPGGDLLLNGRQSLEEPDVVFWVYSMADGNLREIGRSARVRGSSLSPGGSWLAYYVAFEESPDANGLWLLNTTSGEKVRLGIFGSYRWRDDGRLLVALLDTASESHQLVEIDAQASLAGSGSPQPLFDPALTPLRIANGDWAVSPDGQHITFVSADDRNIWVLRL